MEDQHQATDGPLDDVPRGEKGRKAKSASNGAAGAAKAAPPDPIRYAGEKQPLAELRKRLAPDAAKIVKAARDYFESELIEAWDEIVAGVRTSSTEASFSTTMQIKSAKKRRLKAAIRARVRSPREALEFDMYLADDGQLALGLPEGDDGSDDEESE